MKREKIILTLLMFSVLAIVEVRVEYFCFGKNLQESLCIGDLRLKLIWCSTHSLIGGASVVTSEKRTFFVFLFCLCFGNLKPFEVFKHSFCCTILRNKICELQIMNIYV